MENSVITFEGSNNILFLENGIRLKNSKITFKGNNNLVFIKKNKYPVIINCILYNDSTLFLGQDCFINNTLNMILSEQKNILIGDDCLFSFGVWIRNADAHLIYDCLSKNRINHSYSVLIGKHVWIGQSTTILKKTFIGSGSIIGANSCISNKQTGTNEIWAGNPAKKIREHIFWLGNCVHGFTQSNSKIYEHHQSEDYIYFEDIILKKFLEFDTLNINIFNKILYLKSIN